MKGRLWVLAALLVLSAAGLIGMGLAVVATAESVEITETVLRGDRAAAEGVTLAWSVQYAEHLYWDTAVALGGAIAPETTFTYYDERQNSYAGPRDDVAIEGGYTNFGMSGSGLLTDADEEMEGGHMLRPTVDVASRTAPGETREEEVSLADYYDVYPLSLSIHWDNSSYWGSAEDFQFLTDYFSIPVPEAHRVVVSVTKNSSGRVVNVYCNDAEGVGGVSFRSGGLVTEAGAYVYVQVRPFDDRMPLSVEEAPAPGIYFIPIRGTLPNGDLDVDMAGMELFYPLGEGAESLDLRRSAGGEKLLLTAREGEDLTLSVIDPDTAQLLQHIPLLPMGPEVSLWELLVGERCLVAVLQDGSFRVAAEEAGVYTPALAGQLDTEEEFDRRMIYYASQAAWDGERLVWSSHDYRGLHARLAVFDGTGMIFAAQYDHSLDRDPAQEYAAYQLEEIQLELG